MAVRVTRQFLEVLGSTAASEYDESVTSTITFTDVANTEFFESVITPLGLTDVANTEFFESVEDTLSLSDDAEGNSTHQSVTDTLAISDAVVLNTEYHRSVSQSLDLVETINEIGPVYVTVHHALGLQSIPASGSPKRVQLEDFLQLVETLGRAIEVEVTTTITLTDSGARFLGGHDQLNLVQTVSAGKGHDVTDDLSLESVVDYDAVLNRTIPQDLGINHAVTYILISSCTESNYSPFVGEETDENFPPPSTTVPTLGTATLTLTYPFVSPTTTLVLRNPEFDDRDGLSFARVNRLTQGGTLVIYSDPIWSKQRVLQVTIKALKKAKAEELLDFLGDSLGKEVGLLDHMNQQWRGLITKPDNPVSEDERGAYTVSLEFEGEIV